MRHVEPVDWRDQAWPRVARVALVVVVMLVGCVSAFAVECGTTWELQAPSGAAGQVEDHGAATNHCTWENARLSAVGTPPGYSAASCIESDTSMSYDLRDPNNAFVESRTWLRLPLGCSVASEPPASGASAVEFTEVQSSNLLLWAGVVTVFALGYIGGRLR